MSVKYLSPDNNLQNLNMKEDLHMTMKDLQFRNMMKNKNSDLPTLWKTKARILMSKMTSSQLKIFSKSASRRTRKLITTWGPRSIIGKVAAKLTTLQVNRQPLHISNIKALEVVDQAAVWTQQAEWGILRRVHLLLHIRFQVESIVR